MHGYEILHGGDLNENGNCKEGSLVMHGYTFLHVGDLNENHNFRIGKLIIHGCTILQGAILTDMNILKQNKQLAV